ncbi:MIP family Ig-specific serine endopeptidase [Metamycoplasma spumans]|uniref:MIP family Ig-specific serine endopeptidase n=1 Tax=Metamycoplasma spumans TaxID=92406 RepID=UPI0034DDAEA3
MKKRILNILKLSPLFSITSIVMACSPMNHSSSEEVSSISISQNNLIIKISNANNINVSNKKVEMHLVNENNKFTSTKILNIGNGDIQAFFDISNLSSPATYFIKNIYIDGKAILFKENLTNSFSLVDKKKEKEDKSEEENKPIISDQGSTNSSTSSESNQDKPSKDDENPNQVKPSKEDTKTEETPKPDSDQNNQNSDTSNTNQKDEPPVLPGFGDDEQNFPIFPPNLPPKVDRTAENSYPEWASKFKKIDENILYKEIYDRTFAVKFGINISKDPNKKSFLSSSQGTTWLLDYHRFNENKYKLFFATNLHVMGEFSNSLTEEKNKLLNYEDYRGWKVESISLGKTRETQTTFPEKENRYPYSMQNNLKTTYYANANEFTNYSNTDSSAFETKFTNGISAPKIVFAGFDFIDKQYLQEFQEQMKEKIRNKIREIESEENIEDHDEYLGLKRALNNNEFIPAYTDFGVFEIDINLAEIQDEKLKEWFKNAIKSVNQYIQRNNEASILPNTDKSILSYMQTTDYITAINNQGNESNLYNAKDVYTGGYPSIGKGLAVWTRNNPTERKSETENSYYKATDKNSTNFAYPTNSQWNRVTTNDLQLYTNVFGRPLMDFYGFNITMRFSSLSYGASGSVVYNEFGQIIGIYNSVSADVSIDDLLREGRFATLLLSKDYKFGNRTMKAFNLIDGTNKKLYPAQTASFRENLIKLYENGFEDNSYSTALFPNGFKPSN